MVALGLILLALCAALGAGIALSNPDPVSAEAFGVSLSNVSVGGLFLLGCALGALAMLGLSLLLGGAARRRAKSRARKRELAATAAENARLQEQLERTGGAVTPYPESDVREHSRSGRHAL